MTARPSRGRPADPLRGGRPGSEWKLVAPGPGAIGAIGEDADEFDGIDGLGFDRVTGGEAATGLDARQASVMPSRGSSAERRSAADRPPG